jgi:hypothetical protein
MLGPLDLTTMPGHALKISDLVKRLNAVTAASPALRRTGDVPEFNRWNLRTILDAAEIEFLPRKPRGSLYVLESELREKLPTFWERLLDMEARLEAEKSVDDMFDRRLAAERSAAAAP